MRTWPVLTCLVLCACLPRPPDLVDDSGGIGAAGQLVLEPAGDQDFDQVAVGCEATYDVYARNETDDSVEIQQVDLIDGVPDLSFVKGDAVPFPWLLAQDERRLLGSLSFLPLQTIATTTLGTLRVLTDEPDPGLVDLKVPGSALGSRESDTWDAGLYAMDIVVTVARTGSTDDELSYLSEKIGPLVAALDNAGVDFRLLGVTEVDGCHSAGEIWIDNSHNSGSDAQTLFDAMVANTPSVLSAQKGLLRAENALSAANIDAGGCNEGFRRDEAMLHIVGSSDEADTSEGSPLDYFQAQKAAMTAPFEVVYHGIGAERKCGNLETYHGFLEVVDASVGGWVSLCDSDWWDDLSGLVTGMVDRADRSTYRLSRPPLVSSISVELDLDVLDAGDWSYDAASNTVELDESVVPMVGTSVTVAYFPAPDCE